MTDLPYWTLHEAPPDSPKKWAVRVPTSSGRGKVVLFGARGYEDFTTHHDVERRERYRTRHQRDRLDDPYAPGFWSMWALWGESDDLDTAFAAAVRNAKQLTEKTMARKNPPLIQHMREDSLPVIIKMLGTRLVQETLYFSNDEVLRDFVETIATKFRQYVAQLMQKKGGLLTVQHQKALKEADAFAQGLIPSSTPTAAVLSFRRNPPLQQHMESEELSDLSSMLSERVAREIVTHKDGTLLAEFVADLGKQFRIGVEAIVRKSPAMSERDAAVLNAADNFAAQIENLPTKRVGSRRNNPEDETMPHDDLLVDDAIEAFLETADLVDESPAPRLNGLYDPTALKAVFLAGGPGSGKSYTANQLFGLSPGMTLSISTTIGLKVVNSDPYFELFLRQAGVDPKDLGTMSDEELTALTEGVGSPREKAKAVRDKFLNLWLHERLGLLVDGTGDDFYKIKNQKDRLEALGYDTCMIFVNTSLEIAKQRNRQRARRLKDHIVEQIWTACQAQLGAFAELFGDRFVIIDGDKKNGVTAKIRNNALAFLDTPVENQLGQVWLHSQREQRSRGPRSNPEWDGKPFPTIEWDAVSLTGIWRDAALRAYESYLESNLPQYADEAYRAYAGYLTDDQLHHAIIDALDTLKVARTWEDNGAGEEKYLHQLSVLRREQKIAGRDPLAEARGAAGPSGFVSTSGFGSPRSNPGPMREDWLKQAKKAGRQDAMNFGDSLGERREYLEQTGWRDLDPDDRQALLQAWDEGAFGSRQNPEWAKTVGKHLYTGTRYAAESARDLYRGAVDEHRTRKPRPS